MNGWFSPTGGEYIHAGGINTSAPGRDANVLILGGVYNPIGSGGQIDQDGAVLYGQVESANSDDGDSPFSTGGWAITGLKTKSRK
jgi:hypothetical protein